MLSKEEYEGLETKPLPAAAKPPSLGKPGKSVVTFRVACRHSTPILSHYVWEVVV
jgi:hypothetical protein